MNPPTTAPSRLSMPPSMVMRSTEAMTLLPIPEETL